MHIARRNHRLFEHFAKRYNPTVDIGKLLLRVDRLPVTAQQKVIISKRLDFQIIIKLDQPDNILLWSAAQNCAVDLAALTGRAKQQTLAVLDKFTFRDPRLLMVISQMRHRDQLIEINTPDVVGCKHDRMISRQLLDSSRQTPVPSGSPHPASASPDP